MSSKEYAKKHSMDISHVTAVELPLIVKNTDKAVQMLGGKERIKRAINSQYRQLAIQPSSHSVDDRNMELRLRNDPFHHPVQALVNRREKILLRVSIPKSSLPQDYHDNPARYTIKELIEMNNAKSDTPHKVEPVAIINKNYTFRAIADFQMSTKNNPTAQQFNNSVLNLQKFEDMRGFYEQKLMVKDEFKDPKVYENRDHQLVPPPHFSGIRFPFDYRYQKSPYTVTLRDDEGNVKVVMKSDSKKLFTNTVDYYGDSVPQQPLPEIIKKYNWLLTSDLTQEYADKKLFDCIQFLTRLFEAKPIWLRKLLVDVTPEPLKTAVKEALPYVSYCYKNGPWRFCNVKLGVNPKEDRKCWMFQSEYFRLQGLHLKAEPRETSARIVPKTISANNPNSDIRLSEHLFFTGTKLPKAINYQIGDILDENIVAVIKNAQQRGDAHFFRETVDSQDGWINKQVMETIRRIVRYKLRRLQREEPIDPAQVNKIINTDYTEKDDKNGKEKEDEDEATIMPEEEAEEEAEEDLEDIEDENDIDEDVIDSTAVNEESVFSRIKQVDSRTAAKLGTLVGLIKQDLIPQE